MIQEVFKDNPKRLLNVYFTAGFPELNSMSEILTSLEGEKVDMVEIGMPYSDPLSDGPTIQDSNNIALQNGITTDLIFDQLEKCASKVPKIMMGYFNAVYLYGVEKFCERCQKVGVSGIILPDLPIDIYLDQYRDIFERYQLSNIFLITPETKPERIRFIDEHSTSFIYAVSSSSTTGKGTGIQSSQPYLERLKSMNLKTPIMVGFNISTKEDFDFASSYASGAIIGSAFIKHIKESKQLKNDITRFIQSIKN